jgi:hypothetical protein
MEQIPMYASDLIEKLDEEFPHRCIKPGERRDEALAYAGKRMLIDDLLCLLKESGEDASVI